MAKGIAMMALLALLKPLAPASPASPMKLVQSCEKIPIDPSDLDELQLVSLRGEGREISVAVKGGRAGRNALPAVSRGMG